jgi:branched-chain amino acid transport system ATP-binding protein
MLEVRDLHVHYGRVPAVRGVSLSVPAGHIVTLVGANGAGKTTTLRALSGLQRPSAGMIEFAGVRIDGKRPHEILGLGLAHVPEGRRIFPDMTVQENLRLGAYRARSVGEAHRSLDEVYARFPILGERRKQLGGTLSGGEQQMLAIGRALMTAPRMLLLDEPSLGLAPIYVDRVLDIILELNGKGLAILLVEQKAQAALEICDTAYVLETGQVVSSGTPEDLARNDVIRRAYLGVSRSPEPCPH